ncbi:TetR family transcriptional regulator [Lentzea tibetensis]|uniref:TetR family transcriptional regulator n=1 Tax=Lentzea tibetensis TaxID=2591470 RepID=A0A563ETC1_9PSEU|nr:TetR family transcriptional regulator [Lentzea tibetensis]TWP50741.1 TetR family transcriptional regulator [Lentzea tibetensis]
MTGLRERKKAATRAALADAALTLCVEHGVDAVTVEQVATAAGVSLRTFFNYFASKEEAVVAGDMATAGAFVSAFAARPAGEAVLVALGAALHEVIPEHIELSRLHQLRTLRRTPSLLPHLMAAYAVREQELAAAIAARSGVDASADPYPQMSAAATMASLRAILQWWVDVPDAMSRYNSAELIDRLIAQLGAGFTRPS